MDPSCQELSELVRALPGLPEELRFIQFEDNDVSEVRGGNLNDVIRIISREEPSKSVVAKRAAQSTKFFGPDYLLSTARNSFEYKALRRYHVICPGLVPEPYWCSERDRVFIMEDLHGFQDLQQELVRGHVDKRAFVQIAGFLLQVHHSTHKRQLSETSFKSMIDEFRNDGMVRLADQYFFMKPFTSDDASNKPPDSVRPLLPQVYQDERLLERVRALRQRYLTQKECLLHGDLHTSSIMVNGQDAKIIDPEFVTVGPAGFDFGMLIANYLFSYYARIHYPLEDCPNLHKTIWDAIVDTTVTYIGGMSNILTEIHMEALLEDSLGFAGCELIRRIIGAAYVSELEGCPLAEISSFRLGLELLTGEQRPKNIQEFVAHLEMNGEK